MAPVNGKIVQGISDGDGRLGPDVDFKKSYDFKQNGGDLSLQLTKLQNGTQNGLLNGRGAYTLNSDLHSSSSSVLSSNGSHGMLNSLSNGEKDEEEDEESLIHNRLVPLYTSLLDAIGEDPNRNGIKRTPLRAAKAFRFFTKGYQQTIAGKFLKRDDFF